MTEDLPSNGVKGHNFESVNIAYMGGISRTGKPIDNRTDEQKEGLRQLLKELRHRYPDAKSWDIETSRQTRTTMEWSIHGSESKNALASMPFLNTLTSN